MEIFDFHGQPVKQLIFKGYFLLPVINCSYKGLKPSSEQEINNNFLKQSFDFMDKKLV